MTKWVYTFGGGKAEGRAGDRERLGGKGANLAEMCRLGISVPPGMTISAEVCTVYSEQGPEAVRKLIEPDPATPRYLQTVWGFGYVFIPDGQAQAK